LLASTQSRYEEFGAHSVVEDEPKLSSALKEGLKSRGTVSAAQTGEDGFFLIHSERFDLAVLDVMLPGRSGLNPGRFVNGVRFQFYSSCP
jgi:DNA-binding NtrC family response regulator